MVKRHNIILAGTVALAIVGAGTIGYSYYDKVKRGRAHEASVVQMVERFKSCPDDFRARRECISGEQLSAIKTEAEADREAGRFEDAARKFAKIGMIDEAAVMAGRCPESKNRQLREEFSIRREALERALGDPQLSKAPPPQPPAAQSAAQDADVPADAEAAAPDARAPEAPAQDAGQPEGGAAPGAERLRQNP